MKYIVILGDGWADYPDENGETPLSLAKKPNIDAIAKMSVCGLTKTVPDGMKPGSDVANMAVMGYDPAVYYTGRSPLEAASMGIDLGADDVTYRCNLVSLGGKGAYDTLTMKDYSAGELDTESAKKLIEELNAAGIVPSGCELHAGVSYRHCLVRRHGKTGAELTPPHDISGKVISPYLPKGAYADELLAFQKSSMKVLAGSEINAERRAKNVNTADGCWLWGEGTRPSFKPFKELYGLKGAVISAVDLVKGLGIVAGMDSIDVEGACGTINTNFAGKAAAALEAAKTHDFVYLHMEAPDECGHQGDKAGKIRSIELIDSLVVGPIFAEMTKRKERFKMLITPDHPTPLALRTHVGDPVPFVMYDSGRKVDGIETYNEGLVRTTRVYYPSGVDMFKAFIAE
ncbi:MAG TPA: cofactor-independent phosphoglycerate mutase [Firmicutes bacterium]|nr:cofactor-independent phosphoglycerate mutase [Bacillota bacterium]